MRQQVRALQAQASAVQNLPVQNLSVQGSVVGQTRPGVIPSREQSGLQSKTAGLRSKAPVLRSKSPPGLSVGVQESSAGVASESVHEGVNQQSRSPPGYSNADESIWDQAYLSKALQQMKDSEIAKLKFT